MGGNEGAARIPLALATLSHQHASVQELEAFRFSDEAKFLEKAKQQFKGAMLLQTCNRVTILVHGSGESLKSFLSGEGREGYRVLEGEQALRHLLELSSGVDSMIVGEDQIIGQMRRALQQAEQSGAADAMIRDCMEKAIHVGIQVRRRTNINRGAVSIGSAAVELAEQLLGGLENRHILIVGSGEMGMLVTKALAAKGLSAIYVANRTYERAVRLADEIGGRAVRLSDLYQYIALSDVVISCTSAPHPIIYRDRLKAAMEQRRWPLERHPRPLVIIDIAQPRDVEEGAEEIEGVHVYTVDHLRCISETNLMNRKREVEEARAIIEEELDRCKRLLMRSSVDAMVASLYTWAETIRVRERDRALHRMGEQGERASAILDEMTNALVKKLLSEVTFAIRERGEVGDLEGAELILNALTKRARPPRR